MLLNKYYCIKQRKYISNVSLHQHRLLILKSLVLLTHFFCNNTFAFWRRFQLFFEESKVEIPVKLPLFFDLSSIDCFWSFFYWRTLQIFLKIFNTKKLFYSYEAREFWQKYLNKIVALLVFGWIALIVMEALFWQFFWFVIMY